MKHKIKIILVGVVSLICSNSGFAQTSSNELWMSGDINYNISDDANIAMEQGWRISNGISKQTYTDLLGSYKFNKHFKVGGGYRFGQRGHMFNANHFDHRWHLYGTYKYRLKPFTFYAKLRIQSRYRDMFTSENGIIPKTVARFKFTAKYDISKDLNAFIAFEPYYSLNNYKGNDFTRMRYYAGINYDFSKRKSLKVYLLRQNEINRANPNAGNILSLSYSYRIKTSTFRKKEEKLEETIKEN